MKKGFVDKRKTSTEEIVREVIDDIIKDIELVDKKKNKKRKRGKRGGKAHKKKFIYDLKKENNPDFHLDHRPNRNSGKPFHETTTKTLTEFKFVDFYDTPIWDETEGELQKFGEHVSTSDGMKVAQIPPEAFSEALGKFLAWMRELPMDVIVYADPLAHNLIVGFLQFQLDFQTILHLNYILYCFKGEDYHYATSSMTPQSWTNSHLRQIRENKPFSVEPIECPICCEVPTGNPLSSTSPHGFSTCQTCGQQSCNKCMMRFLMKQCAFKTYRDQETDKMKGIMKKPDHTCPFCRGGFYHPQDLSFIPNGFIKHVDKVIASVNGETIAEECLQKENQDAMVEYLASEGYEVSPHCVE